MTLRIADQGGWAALADRLTARGSEADPRSAMAVVADFARSLPGVTAAAVVLVESDELVWVAGSDPPSEDLRARLAHRVRLADLAPGPPEKVRRHAGDPVGIGPEAVVVPFTTSGRPAGALCAVLDDRARPATQEGGPLLEALAALAGAAIHWAGAAERAARDRRALEALHGLAGALLAGAAVDDVLQLLALRALEVARADLATIVLPARDQAGLEIRVAVGAHADAVRGQRFAREGSLSGDVLAAGRPIRLADLPSDPRGHQPVVALGVFGPWLSVPLWFRGRAAGTLSLGRTRARPPFSEDESVMLQTFATQASLSIERGQVQQEVAEVAHALRQALVPPSLPALPGIDLAARLRPRRSGIGGDFYDVISLPGGEWGFVVGDIAGSGPSAAALTALARHTVLTAAHTLRQPADLLGVLNESMLSRTGDEQFCTAVYARARVRRRSVRLVLARAGHPYPVLLRSGGEAALIRPPGEPLGIRRHPDIGTETVILDPGDALVLYTDGLVESRGPGAQHDAGALLDVLRDVAGQPAEAIAHHLDSMLEARRERLDDVAFVVIAAPEHRRS